MARSALLVGTALLGKTIRAQASGVEAEVISREKLSTWSAAWAFTYMARQALLGTVGKKPRPVT